MKWLRLYSDVLHNPKVQKLHPATFKHWINVLCLASENDPRGELPDMKAIAFSLRVKPNEAQQIIEKLIDAGLVERAGVGRHLVHNWAGRQVGSDDVAARVRRHREAKLTASAHVSGDGNVTEAIPKRTRGDRDTDTEEKNQKTSRPTRSARTFTDDSREMKAARYLFTKIRANNPEAKEPNWQGWARDFDLIFRVDKRDPGDVRAVVDWSQSDPFWLKNALSPAAIRKQYDRLILKVRERAPEFDRTRPVV